VNSRGTRVVQNTLGSNCKDWGESRGLVGKFVMSSFNVIKLLPEINLSVLVREEIEGRRGGRGKERRNGREQGEIKDTQVSG
jgi:hypothetical protein